MKMTKVSYWKVTGPFKISECVTVRRRDYVLARIIHGRLEFVGERRLTC